MNPTAPSSPLAAEHIRRLPAYIRPGHGFLILRDLHVDELTIDGLDLPDPKGESHPYFIGAFRGYFNVPPGPHEIVAELAGRSSSWRVEVQGNEAYVRNLDWEAGGWVDPDAATARQFRDLALSGSMLQARALRPWPFASLYFAAPPADLVLNGTRLQSPQDFWGLTGLRPGHYSLQVDGELHGFTLPVGSMQLVDFRMGQTEFVDPRLGDGLLRRRLESATYAALIPASSLALRPD